MEARIASLEELAEEAARFAAALVPKEASATLVTLSGELGAGKTAFTQAVAKALGVAESVTSPTFVLEKIYDLPPSAAPAAGAAGERPQAVLAGFTRLVHIDAYRLNGAAELAPLGFDELMQDAGNLVMLEWPERVGLDTDERVATRISVRANNDGSRTLTIS